MPRVFLVLQTPIKTDVQESKVPLPKDPSQPEEPKAEEKPVEEQQEKEAGQLLDTESVGVVKSEAERGQ